MSLDNTKLLDFLGEVDKEFSRKIVVVAVGGTAMTLLKAKPSTIDVDFTISEEFYDEFERAKKIVSPGFRVDLFHGGMVFITALPDDYLKKSKPIRTKLKNIQLRTLDPVDIIITKIARLDERDEQDIESCIKKFKIKKNQIIRRAEDIGYSGNDGVFKDNLATILKKFFG
ncbi:DUF6036 family nucleotidyltransferase [Candidatus Nitrosotenuis uzonensis]|uniref:DUF6036 domain-containing protein n=1 Tax=Candidatus Nitrosotenuis uzonensis TaxID=1407055 RepID=A0A812F274_9ARCH|nr:DUF6036 family nucleotidyltransferase [Candidatus Nitrosotenuis uzonensis]CAE6489451.1 conserved hypothetical protein [Candidatus Nitrosotenuis uzonensis]